MKNIFTLAMLLLWGGLLAAQTEWLTTAEQMPYFPGCEKYSDNTDAKRNCSNQELVQFIADNLVYPRQAKKEGIEGTVYVSFVVQKNGTITDGAILRDIGGGCGKAALDIIASMPTWEPGIDQNKTVAIKLNLPISFSFKNVSKENASSFEINWGDLTGRRIRPEQLEKNLEKEVMVRDIKGNDRPITELIFSFEKGSAYYEKSSKGGVNKNLQKVVAKASAGGQFTIVAVIQGENEKIRVKRTFKVL